MHSLQVEQLAFDPKIRVFERIFKFLLVFFDAFFQISRLRMSEDAFIEFLVRVVVNAHFFVLHDGLQKVLLCLVVLATVVSHLLELLFLNLHDAYCLLQVVLEKHDALVEFVHRH